MIHRQAGVYSAFPILYQLTDPARTLAVHFGAGVTSSHLEPRREPRNFLSTDGGRTWPENEIVALRADGSGRPGDNGYPISTELANGTLVTVYYLTREGITGVEVTRWPRPRR